MRVVTGLSSKSEGFLYVTEKSLAELAAHIGLSYHQLEHALIAGEDCGTARLFVASGVKEEVDELNREIDAKITVDDYLRRLLDEHGTVGLGRGIWEVFDTEVVLDQDLAEVVTW